MELVNDFTVSVPVDEAWKTLTDVERIAPCMPGAQLQEIEGDTYRGLVKIKVGPITASFKGEANFVERDEQQHRAVLKAAGRDTGGKGNASALITAQLEPSGSDSTHVTVTTDLTITGKVAQFGRGALADVSTKLLNQFVQQLETTVLNEPNGAGSAQAALQASSGGEVATAAAAAGATPPAEVATAAAQPQWSAPATAEPTAPGGGTVASPSADRPAQTGGIRKIEGPEAAPIDLLGTAGAPMAKRLIPVALVVLVLFLVLRRRRH